MRAKTIKLAALLLPALTGLACRQPAPVTLDAAGVTPAADYSSLGVVLEKCVTSRGLIIPDALAKHAAELDGQLKLLAVTGPAATPALFPTEEHAIAYWYNARAAWAMKLALLGDCASGKAVADMSRPFVLDGRQMTLERIDRVLESLGDWRLKAAAPCASIQRAGLPERPFSHDDIRARAAERLNEFIDDQERFVIDVPNMAVLVPPVLWRHREEIIAQYHAMYGGRGANLLTALLPHVGGSAQRRLQDAIGYDIRPADSRAGLLALPKGI